VLFGEVHILLQMPGMIALERSYREVMAHKHKYAIMIQQSWRIKKLRMMATKLANRVRWIRARIRLFRLRIYIKKAIRAAVRI
jgi:hypothetical protein